jgi:hypothetical protein
MPSMTAAGWLGGCRIQSSFRNYLSRASKTGQPESDQSGIGSNRWKAATTGEVWSRRGGVGPQIPTGAKGTAEFTEKNFRWQNILGTPHDVRDQVVDLVRRWSEGPHTQPVDESPGTDLRLQKGSITGVPLTTVLWTLDLRALVAGEWFLSTTARPLKLGASKMRRVVFISVILTLVVTFDSMTVRASNSSVTLSAPTTGSITFSGNNGSPIMTITGPLNGMALSGTGALASATSFTLSSGSIVFTKEHGDPGDYASTGTLTFMLNNGTLLTGTLSNITLDQHGKMVILAGTLNGEQVSMIIDLQFGTPLSKLKGPHSTELGAFSAGEAASSVTPEPGTMLLFGSGLLLLAGVLRRKLIAA